jgi:hypothetical protein
LFVFKFEINDHAPKSSFKRKAGYLNEGAVLETILKGVCNSLDKWIPPNNGFTGLVCR